MRLEQLISDLKVQLINDALDNPEQKFFTACVENEKMYVSVCLSKHASEASVCVESGREYPNIEKYIASQFDYDDIIDEAFDDEDNLDIYQRNGYDSEEEFWRERI